MFESLNGEGPKDAMRYMTSLLVSIVVHTVVVGALVVFPLLFFNVVQADELIGILIEPPSIPVPPPPQPPPPARVRTTAEIRVVRGDIDAIPRFIPDGIPPADDAVAPYDFANAVQGISPVGASVPAGNALSYLIEASRQPELPPVKPPVRPEPIRISGPIQEGKIIHKVSPIYPELAIRAHVSGEVTLEATIDEEGNVTDLKILNGHPLLRDAAYEAVRQWKYRPTLIGGEPVPVLALVSVIFRFR